MGDVILSYDTALAFWNCPDRRAARRPLDKLECDRALADAKNGVPDRVAAWLEEQPEFSWLRRPLDIVVPDKDRFRVSSLYRFHTQQGLFPAGSLYPLAAFANSSARYRVLVASPELCFVQMASEVGDIEAAEIGCELCGDYALAPDGEVRDSTAQTGKSGFIFCKSRTTPEKLRDYAEQACFMPGVQRARRAAKWVVGRACCPRQTQLALALSMPRRRGGFGLPKPLLNMVLPLSVEERELLGVRVLRPDFLWPEQGVALEYAGKSKCAFDEARKQDERKRILSEVRNLELVRLDEGQFEDLDEMVSIVNPLRKRFSRQPKRWNPSMIAAREELHDFLLRGPRHPRIG